MATGLTRLNTQTLKILRRGSWPTSPTYAGNIASFLTDLDTRAANLITFTQRLSLFDAKLPATGLQLAATAGSSILGLTAGTHGSASPLLITNDSDGTTKSDSARFLVPISPFYVAGTTVTARVRAKVSAAAQVSSTVDVLIFAADLAGGVSADLVTTAAQAITTTVGNYDFTVTPTALTPGSVLDILITVALNDTGGSGALLGSVYNVELIYNA